MQRLGPIKDEVQLNSRQHHPIKFRWRDAATASFVGSQAARDWLVQILALYSLFLSYGSLGYAQVAEEARQLPTDAALTDLFPLNPAILVPSGFHVGLLAARHEKMATLDQEAIENGDKITANTQDEVVDFGVAMDLGAGAGIALTHETLFRTVTTELASQQNNRQPSEEHTKQQHSTLRLLIELTTAWRAGVAIRYLYKDVSLLGDPFLAPTATTEYKTTMIGYGSGFVYYFDKIGGISYAYFPPLRGKTEIYGEEFIIVEPGFFTGDGFYAPNSTWRLGFALKHWIHELDDRADGTTSADNQTNISLFGLDVDQYLIPQQMLMLGADVAFSNELDLKFAVAQEKAEFNFHDLMRYNRVDIQQDRNEANPQITYNRLRLGLRFGRDNMEFVGGFGIFKRRFDFPTTMRGGTYEGSGREMYGTIGMKF